MNTAVNGAGAHAPAPHTRPLVLELAVKGLDESPTNPRKNFGDLAELAADLKVRGLLQPVMARPKGKRHELIFGARRLRAAKLAGITELPVIVREMSDVEVIEVQLIENAKRLDLHPLEEADTYQVLLEKHGYRAEDIAAKVGKSLSHVYQRLKLCALTKEARQAFLEGKLTPATANLIARIPDPILQLEALEGITTPSWNGEVMSKTRAVDYVQEKYMLRLADAPFNRGDATLVETAGPCTTCPKRTGNQKELFADVKSPDTCTDPRCFGDKRDAHWANLTSAAAEKGQRVISDTQAKKLFPYSDNLSQDADFVDLADKNYSDAKQRTWKAILGKDAPATVLARDVHGGIHELVVKSEAAKALKSAGKAIPDAVKARPTSSLSDGEKKKRDNAAIEKEVGRRSLADVVAKAAKKGTDTTGFWMVLVRGIVRCSWHDVHVDIAKRRGIEVPKSKNADEVLLAAAKKMDLGELRGLALELVACRGMNGGGETFKEVCAHFRVITARHEKAVRAEKKK